MTAVVLMMLGAALVCTAAAMVYPPAGLALLGLGCLRLSREVSREVIPPDADS